MRCNAKCSCAAVTLAMGLFFLVTAARADTITLTLANPVQSTLSGGGTFSFVATVSAPATNAALENLNGALFSVPSPATLDDSGYLDNFPLSLDPGQDYTGELFSVTLPAVLSDGLYSGTFSITGGPDYTDNDVLATVNYAINVTPEPASWLLLATGMLGMAALWLRRKHSPVPPQS